MQRESERARETKNDIKRETDRQTDREDLIFIAYEAVVEGAFLVDVHVVANDAPGQLQQQVKHVSSKQSMLAASIACQ